MKFSSRRLVATSAVLALTLAACGGSDDSDSDAGSSSTSGTATESTDNGGSGGSTPEELTLSVANVVNGALGDQGFFDDAQRGMDAIEDAGATTKVLQADANNPAQWKANLESVSGGDYDIVITGTSQMVDILDETAPKYADQDYILYDAVVEQPNVASIVYKQNEGSFLAGVLAALVTSDTETFPLANDDKVVGLVGGMDIPVINDFVAGFEAGVAAVDDSIEVKVSYVGDFNDSPKGYDQGKAMIEQGADVIYQVAGGSGVGALQAAADEDVYAIGVDSNQNQLQPGHVLASMLKNIGGSLVLAVDAAQEGTLDYGATTSYGLANDGVGLDFDDNEDIVPQSVIDEIDSYKQQVVDGDIDVPTAEN